MKTPSDHLPELLFIDEKISRFHQQASGRNNLFPIQISGVLDLSIREDDDETVEIRCIDVDPRHRRKGIFRHIVNALFMHRHTQTIYVTGVSPTSPTLIPALNRLGFQESHLRQHSYVLHRKDA